MTGYTRYTHENQLDLNRQQLEEALQQSQTQSAKNAIAQLLSKAGSTLLSLFVNSDQPRIQATTVNGEQVWKVYDPISGSRAAFTSEQDLRAWLEQRYYQ